MPTRLAGGALAFGFVKDPAATACAATDDVDVATRSLTEDMAPPTKRTKTDVPHDVQVWFLPGLC